MGHACIAFCLIHCPTNFTFWASDKAGTARRHLKRCIVDKNARIGEEVTLINKDNIQETEEYVLDYGFWVKDGIIVVVKDAHVPAGTVF